MNSLIHKSNTLLGRLVIAALLLIVAIVISVANVTHADNGVKNQSGRILTIHDRGTTKVVVTEAANISDALKEAGFVIDSNDVVEPAVTEKLVASSYQVNIYRARPVIIVDGNSRTKVITAYQTAEQIAQSVGIKLYREDKTILGVTDNIIADGAGLQLTIIRSTPFELTLYGKTTIVRTQAKTIATMLTEKGIKLSSDDRVSLGLDTSITDGLAVRIWREGKQTITVDEPVNFEVEKIENIDMSVGYHEVKTAGQKGQRNVSYEIIIQDGVEVGRTEIASITIKQPSKQVETVGVKGKYATPSERENIIWEYLLSQGYSRVQSAGIMGNLKQERTLFETSDVSGGLGIVQWTGNRRLKLIATYPDSYTNIYSQLNYLTSELNGGWNKVNNAIKGDTSNDPKNVALIFQDDFEVCNPYYCMQDQRVTYARNILASH